MKLEGISEDQRFAASQRDGHKHAPTQCIAEGWTRAGEEGRGGGGVSAHLTVLRGEWESRGR